MFFVDRFFFSEELDLETPANSIHENDGCNIKDMELHYDEMITNLHVTTLIS